MLLWQQSELSRSEEEGETNRVKVPRPRRRAKCRRPNAGEADWEGVKRDEWQRELLSSSTDDEEIREAKRMKSEEEDCMRFEESRGRMAEAYPTRGMEVRDRASENVDRKQGEEKELTRELVTDKVIMALVLLEERTCSMGERL